MCWAACATLSWPRTRDDNVWCSTEIYNRVFIVHVLRSRLRFVYTSIAERMLSVTDK